MLLPLLAVGDLGVGVWLLWHARRHHGWDRPGVPVTGVLLLMCALFLAWLACSTRSHPRCLRVAAERAGAHLTGAHVTVQQAAGQPHDLSGRPARQPQGPGTVPVSS